MKSVTKKCIVTAGIAAAMMGGPLLLQSQAKADPFDDQWNNQSYHVADPQGSVPIVRWSGNVDADAVVVIRGQDVHDHIRWGKPTTDVSVDERNPLPDQVGDVYLRNWDGRGDVRIVQQPDPSNNFTAVVRIEDPQRGRGFYHFSLGWTPAP